MSKETKAEKVKRQKKWREKRHAKREGVSPEEFFKSETVVELKTNKKESKIKSFIDRLFK